ncbi:hypothetical protein BLSTO_03375 [Blastocystis sp. subtype 1]
MITNLIVYLTLTEMIVLYNHVQGDSIPNQQNTQLRVPIEVRSADTQAYSNIHGVLNVFSNANCSDVYKDVLPNFKRIRTLNPDIQVICYPLLNSTETFNCLCAIEKDCSTVILPTEALDSAMDYPNTTLILVHSKWIPALTSAISSSDLPLVKSACISKQSVYVCFAICFLFVLFLFILSTAFDKAASPSMITKVMACPMTTEKMNVLFPSIDVTTPVEDECPICMSPFQKHTRLRCLRCGHRFHRDCIDRWVVRCKAECPLCKRLVWMC